MKKKELKERIRKLKKDNKSLRLAISLLDPYAIIEISKINKINNQNQQIKQDESK